MIYDLLFVISNLKFGIYDFKLGILGRSVNGT